MTYRSQKKNKIKKKNHHHQIINQFVFVAQKKNDLNENGKKNCLFYEQEKRIVQQQWR